MKKIVIVGGLPNPIGGVTTFLKRFSDKYYKSISLFIDCYPNNEKSIPNGIVDKFLSIRTKYFLPIYFIIKYKSISNSLVFFNFSNINSLLMLGLLVKPKETSWHLMLHHGDISINRSFMRWLYRLIIKRVDVIYVLSDKQCDALLNITHSDKIIRTSSYISASVDKESHKYSYAKDYINSLRNSGVEKIFICSGNSSDLYNHFDILALSQSTLSNCYIIMFVYGPKSGRSSLVNSVSKLDNVEIFQDKDEDLFNCFLSLSDCYVRPTEKDSFGIAVADAINFGVSAVASNVCPRYKGAYIYNHSSVSSLDDALKKYLKNEDLEVSEYDIQDFKINV